MASPIAPPARQPVDQVKVLGDEMCTVHPNVNVGQEVKKTGLKLPTLKQLLSFMVQQ